jgi:hypothetical protein
MFAGTYPLGVPSRNGLPPGAFASTEDVGQFVDVGSARWTELGVAFAAV